MNIRSSRPDDLVRIQAIYAHHVLTGAASFEEVPPGLEELARRRDDVLARGMPYVVAEMDGRVIGYAYAGPYRLRTAYRYSVEDSIYLDPECMGRGAGRALLSAVIDRCEEAGCRQMIAVIGDSANASSIGLHRSLGFEPAGLLKAVGFKFGRWVDSVLMQRPLGNGDASPPEAP
ncbi:N-acetyltransferase [Azospirillum brasilense]|uniref:N-acetyltransferase n=1 Tax=Azospirillum brasilense TaxID=192 RepID=A0A0P0F6C2_AZOBR|nr:MULTISPECIES: GNAT family N-acetyltransferase [Azospirillum]ALJ35357.1 GCN5 family acetyltransferase [Azospirillum brasilense]MDW7555101.1 N-acetyltransferase family protein [Azospirillum brasilense]MDW7594878.1 N-acetyltransferase family protein [Azospirillum brasilense]MDW7629907.1 N-acetyltransferase family protein [Azospirillum brasilense]MDX5954066.1 GNAT family N-acetyltransferase [Azospirillum brasilense]